MDGQMDGGTVMHPLDGQVTDGGLDGCVIVVLKQNTSNNVEQI